MRFLSDAGEGARVGGTKSLPPVPARPRPRLLLRDPLAEPQKLQLPAAPAATSAQPQSRGCRERVARRRGERAGRKSALRLARSCLQRGPRVRGPGASPHRVSDGGPAAARAPRPRGLLPSPHAPSLPRRPLSRRLWLKGTSPSDLGAPPPSDLGTPPPSDLGAPNPSDLGAV